jgi:hypothetical protein
MPEGDQRSGEGKESAVHVAEAFVTDAQAAELMEPTDRAFDNPAFAAEAATMRRAAFCEVRHDAFGAQALAIGRAIVGPVGVDAANPGAQLVWQAEEQGKELTRVVVVGRRNGGDQGDAAGISQDVVLGAGLGPVDRIGPRLGPPKTARTLLESTATRDQSIFPAWSSRWMSAICSRSHTPAASHSCNRRQQVIPLPQPSSCGKSSQPMPVLSTKIIPVSARRLSMRLRPGYRRRRGFSAGNSGAISLHSLSSTSGFAILRVDHISDLLHSSFC